MANADFRATDPVWHYTLNSHAPVEPVVSADNPPVYNPAGGLHMSIADWARFVRWALAADAGHQSLPRTETARELTSEVVPPAPAPSTDSDGRSIRRWAWAEGRAATHGGSNALKLH